MPFDIIHPASKQYTEGKTTNRLFMDLLSCLPNGIDHYVLIHVKDEAEHSELFNQGWDQYTGYLHPIHLEQRM